MSEGCVACGSAMPPDATRCPGCGLVFGESEEPRGPLIASVPPHAGLYVGDVPTMVAEAAQTQAPALESEAESPVVLEAVPPRARFWKSVTIVGCLLVVACVAAIFVARSHPNDGYARIEGLFAAYRHSPAFAPVDIPDEFDAEEIVDKAGREDPAAFRSATAAHRPFPEFKGGSLHPLFDAFLDRFLEINPGWSIGLGIQPFPKRSARFGPELQLRNLMLLRDASRVLRTWPDAERLSPHDRADRAALLGWVESRLRADHQPDIGGLEGLRSIGQPLVHLAQIESAPVEERLAATCVVLDAIPARLRDALVDVEHPPHALVMLAAEELDDDVSYLAELPRAFARARRASLDRLQVSAAAAGVALKQCAAQLRDVVALRAKGALGAGARDVELLLRVGHDVPDGAEAIYERAFAELCDAHDEMRRLPKDVREHAPTIDVATRDVQVDALRGARTDWIASPPEDAGLRVLPMPATSASHGTVGEYMDAGSLGTSTLGVVHVADLGVERNDFERAYHALMHRHTLAHETYPGHRMEAMSRRDACPLRRFIDDRFFVEGWGAHAEDLLHETGRCVGGPVDDYVRASRRASRATETMLVLLIETRAASDASVAALLHAINPARDVELALARHARSSCYELTYFVGLDQIERLRRDEESRLGSAFDLREFDRRLLSEGPIPIALIEEEWRAERK